MQKALNFAEQQGASLVCYLQDDTQMVRPLAAEDEQYLAGLFAENEGIGFIHPCFLRGRNRARDERHMYYDEHVGVYYRQGARRSAGTHFSALLIMQPTRLLARGWSFLESEPRNDEQAARLFGPMPYLHVPFAMWLPEVPAYRGKRKTLALKIAERQRNSGYFPFRILDAAETKVLAARSHVRPPFAEDVLECIDGDPPGPWAYHPMQGSRWLQKLCSVENALRRWLRF
ncbi:MAG: hypothetical protein LAT61_00460 [Alcanivorax sp.]|nr:hypothetical protein [Alcanivorax sp.]